MYFKGNLFMTSFCYVCILIFCGRGVFKKILDYISNSKYVHINRELMKGSIVVQI